MKKGKNKSVKPKADFVYLRIVIICPSRDRLDWGKGRQPQWLTLDKFAP